MTSKIFFFKKSIVKCEMGAARYVGSGGDTCQQ